MFKKSEKDSVENDTVNSDSEEKNTVESESEKLQENASEENDVDVREKKKLLKKLKNKFVTGVLCGVTFTLIITFGSAYIYSYATGRYFVFKANNKMRVGNEILDNKSMDKINELRTYMDLYYYKGYDADKVKNSMYSGIVAGLGDKYSTYYTKEEYKAFKQESAGEYCGIGTQVTQDPNDKSIRITKVYDGSPASQGGLKEGDIIKKVNEKDVSKQELAKVAQDLRGKENTKVKVEVFRKEENKNISVELTRKKLELPSVTYKVLNGNIGYIAITEFQDKTDEQFKDAIDNLKKQNVKGFIFDVRSNPGGMLNSVVSMLNNVLPKGVVVYTKDKYGNKEVARSDGKNRLDYPITVLINGESASASEIFAGAIKDYKYGTIIGEKSFGKGIVQSIFKLEDGDAIKITTARYYTPNGHYIHGKGIKPDIEVKLDIEAQKDGYDINKDNQVQKAIEVLDEKINGK
jgi:carboxyl-terminal processing protease